MIIRKYNSEFAINMRANQILVFRPTFLAELADDLFAPPYQCHIYGIARRPRVTLDTKSIEISPETIRGDVIAHTQNGPQKYSFEIKNFPGNPIAHCICNYPYSELRFVHENGETAVEGPVVQFLTIAGVGRLYPELVNLELLYLGQAYGKDGSRTAPKRLSHHETLQKILAEAIHRSPEMDIWIVLFSFEDLLIASLNGRAGVCGTSSQENLAHMSSVLGTRMSEAQRINYCEAALIRYFQPSYNTEFKSSFPSPNHTSYEECYRLDLNSVTVELDCTEVGLRLWTPTVAPSWVHFPLFVLHSMEERRNMFDFFPELGSPAITPVNK